MDQSRKNARLDEQSVSDNNADDINKRRKLSNSADTNDQQLNEQQQSATALDLFNVPFNNGSESNSGSQFLDQLSLNTSALLPDDLFTFVTNNADGRYNSTLATADSIADNSAHQLIVSSPVSFDSSISTAQLPDEQRVLMSVPSQQMSLQPQQTNEARPSIADGVHASNTHAVSEQINSMAALDPPDPSVHTIVVGGRAFRLSWESLKSDATPTNFFIEHFRKITSTSLSTTTQQPRKRIMHIDRDPDLFEQVVRHLRGYYIRPKDDVEYQALLYDANYYGLTRLRKSLLEYAFINVGGRLFRVSWDLFSKDGRHNFFTGPLRHSLHTPPKGEVNAPPLYIDRDPDIFQNIIDHLRGYSIRIRDEEHRKNLLRDAQYYVFRQLYDRLLSTMPGTMLAGYSDAASFAETFTYGWEHKPELLLKLSDVRLSNLVKPHSQDGYLGYKRSIDGDVPHRLLIQLSHAHIKVHASSQSKSFGYNIEISNDGDKTKLDDIAKALNIEFNEYTLRAGTYTVFRIDSAELTAKEWQDKVDAAGLLWLNCDNCEGECQNAYFVMQRGIFRVFAQGDIVLEPLLIEAYLDAKAVNAKRQFLD